MISCSGPTGYWSDPRVILISIDGLRSDIVNNPAFAENHPYLARLMAEGEYCANVQTVFPSLTYPSHTSMITGVMPDKHGIVNNRPFIPEKNFVDWYWYADSIKVPTLITKAKQKGLVTLGVSWLGNMTVRKRFWNQPRFVGQCLKTAIHQDITGTFCFTISLWMRFSGKHLI